MAPVFNPFHTACVRFDIVPFVLPRQLRKSVCLALFKMWCGPELHYSMLEKACEDGDTTMAECLIELGADINAKTKSESLIYQVEDAEL